MAQVIAGTVAKWLTSAGLTATIGSGAAAVSVATLVAQLGTSVLFGVISRKLASRGGAGAQAQIDLDRPASVVVRRFVYGRARVAGTPAATIVRNGVCYVVYILNSRPSDGIEAVEFDNRPVSFTGDLYDYATGATATGSPFGGYVKMWAGLGGQTGIPAQILTEVGDATSTDDADFWPTDAWTGRTVLWVRLAKGPAASAQQRWQRMPPALRVTMRGCAVWDPRDPAQDPDDPATWDWSENQALALIDALRFNPVSRLPVRLLHMASLLRAADLADEAVALKAGGTEPRYRVGGVLPWDPGQELYQLLQPLVAAGGGALVQAGGLLGYRPGEYLTPADTITDVLDEAPLEFENMVPGRDIPRAIRAVYPDPGAAWEDASLLPIVVPGGGGWTGGDDRVEDLALPMVPFHRQANRLAQIMARQRGRQKRISGVLLPRHLDLIAGANVTLMLPGAGDVRSGVYTLTRIHPAHWLDSPDGVAFRLPFDTVEDAPEVWAWNAATDEQDVQSVTVVQPDLALAPPSDLVATGATLDFGVVVNFDFLPSSSSAVTGYLWEWRLTGGDWQTGGTLAADTLVSGRVIGRLAPAPGSSTVEIRVRAQALGRESDWVTVTGVSTPAPVEPGP